MSFPCHVFICSTLNNLFPFSNLWLSISTSPVIIAISNNNQDLNLTLFTHLSQASFLFCFWLLVASEYPLAPLGGCKHSIADEVLFLFCPPLPVPLCAFHTNWFLSIDIIFWRYFINLLQTVFTYIYTTFNYSFYFFV